MTAETPDRAADPAPTVPGAGGGVDERDAAMSELLGIRSSIDNIDAALIHLLAERFKFTQQVGRLKARHGLPPSDPDREKRQIARLRALAEDAHLDPAFAEKWFNFVVAEVIQHHEELAGNGGSDEL
jgi:chorismate mutase